MFSQYASGRHRNGKPIRLSFVDIRKAYFNGRPTRIRLMHFPKELGLPSNLVARLVRCAYGCRDAGHIWEVCYRSALEAIGLPLVQLLIAAFITTPKTSMSLCTAMISTLLEQMST